MRGIACLQAMLHCCWLQSRKQDCYHTSWGVISRKCTHANDVGVICDVPNVPVRLVGGPNAKWGRLEVQVAGQWGTVSLPACRLSPVSLVSCVLRVHHVLSSRMCQCVLRLPPLACTLQVCTDGISEVRRDELAQAVCRQLNYSPINARVIGNALYGRVRGADTHRGCGRLKRCVALAAATPVYLVMMTALLLSSQGTGRIWGNDFDCDGTEPALGRCKHRPWGSLKLGPAGACHAAWDCAAGQMHAGHLSLQHAAWDRSWCLGAHMDWMCPPTRRPGSLL